MNDIKEYSKKIALQIWDYKKQYTIYARSLGLKYGSEALSWDDAHDLFNDTITEIINAILDNKKSAYNSERNDSLDWFVKMRILNIYKDQQKHIKGVKQAEINNEIEKLKNNKSLNYSGRKISLIKNPLKRYNNDPYQIILTTNKPHKASINDAINITGLVGINDLTKDRLGYKLGNDIYISKVLDDNNIVINLNFQHNFDETSVGGENCFLFVKSTPLDFKKDNTYEILSGENEENEQLDQMEIDKLWQLCFEKLKPKQQAVYKLNQMRSIAGVNLGEKENEPKTRNDGKPLNNGDIYFPKDEHINKKRKASENILVFKMYRDGKWLDKHEDDSINKPLDTNAIANILNWPKGTVSYLLAGAKNSMGNCLGAAEYA